MIRYSKGFVVLFALALVLVCRRSAPGGRHHQGDH